MKSKEQILREVYSRNGWEMEENETWQIMLSAMEEYANQTPSNKSSELPSDEEIEQVATDKSHEAWTVSNCRTTFQEAFINGAKWMRSKLQTREVESISIDDDERKKAVAYGMGVAASKLIPNHYNFEKDYIHQICEEYIKEFPLQTRETKESEWIECKKRMPDSSEYDVAIWIDKAERWDKACWMSSDELWLTDSGSYLFNEVSKWKDVRTTTSSTEWISVEDRLPNEKEQEENWKFSVCDNSAKHEEDKWTDAAYLVWNESSHSWNNGECDIYPTHWTTMKSPPKQIKA